MNRKEFTNLLLEWRKNFVNERGANAIYHRSDPGEGYLINPSLSQIEGLEDYIQAYIKKFNLSSLNDVANLQKRKFENGIVLPKTNEVIKMISDFFLEMAESQEKSKEILATAGNDECVIVHFTEGDFTLGSDDQSREEIYHWTIHDLEHSMISMTTSAEFYFSEAMLKSTKLGKDIIEKYNVDRAFTTNMYQVLENETLNTDVEMPKINQNSSLIADFFNTIDFTRKVGLDDLSASIMSYCYIKMKNADDLEEISNLSEAKFSEEDKEILKRIFAQYKTITQNSFDKNIKEKLKGCIVIVLSL